MSGPALWLQVQERLVGAAGVMLALGLVSLVVTAVTLPTFIARLPADHFSTSRVHVPVPRTLPWLFMRALKNTLGVVLIVAGVAMVVLPGQGLLTILIGLVLVEFPGKRGLERRLVGRPGIRALLDRVRHARGVPPLKLD